MRTAATLVLLLAAATAANAQTTLYQGPVDTMGHHEWTLRSNDVPAALTRRLSVETLASIRKTDFKKSVVIVVTGPGVRINRAHLNSGTKTVEVLIQEAPCTDEETHAHVIRITRTVFLSSLTARWGRKDGFEGWTEKFEREKLEPVSMSGVLRHAATQLETLKGTYTLMGVRQLAEALPHDEGRMRWRLRDFQEVVFAEIDGLLSPSRREIVQITRVEIPGYTLHRTELSGVPDGEGHVAPFTELYSVTQPFYGPANAGKQVTYQGWYSKDLSGNVLSRFLIEDVLALEGHRGSPQRISAYEINREGFPMRGALPTFGEPSQAAPTEPAPSAALAAKPVVARRGMLDVVAESSPSSEAGDSAESERYGSSMGTTVNGNLPVFMDWEDVGTAKYDVWYMVKTSEGYRNYDKAIDGGIRTPGEVFHPKYNR